MKLIDLLVQELPKHGGWPEGAEVLAQDEDGQLADYDPDTLQFRAYFRIELDKLCDRFRIRCTQAKDSAEMVTREQYEAALAASQQPAWSGEGLPPVGVTCEHCPGGTTQTEWEVVTVLGISERPGGVFTDYWLRKKDGSTYIIGNPYRFRQIRTDAERRRDDFVKGLCDYLDDLTEWDSPVGKVHAVAIYEAIAAGKIPGVKLEANHE